RDGERCREILAGPARLHRPRRLRQAPGPPPGPRFHSPLPNGLANFVLCVLAELAPSRPPGPRTVSPPGPLLLRRSCPAPLPAQSPGTGQGASGRSLLPPGLLAQGGDLGPELLPRLTLRPWQFSQRHLPADGLQVGILLPVRQPLLDDLPK